MIGKFRSIPEMAKLAMIKPYSLSQKNNEKRFTGMSQKDIHSWTHSGARLKLSYILIILSFAFFGSTTNLGSPFQSKFVI
tara:strand:- start:94 stop:333 length:240 start_codon:yes stop_codon:yes gene_type:complete